MHDVVDKSQVRFRPLRSAKLTGWITIGIGGFFTTLGFIGQRDIASLILGAVCFGPMGLFLGVLMVSVFFLRARLMTPRRVMLLNSVVILEYPNSRRAFRIRACRWRLGSARKDTVLGLCLEDKECVLLYIRDRMGGNIALGYSHGTPLEWLDALEEARRQPPIEPPAGPNRIAEAISIGLCVIFMIGLLYLWHRLSEVGWIGFTDADWFALLGSVLSLFVAVVIAVFQENSSGDA